MEQLKTIKNQEEKGSVEQINKSLCKLIISDQKKKLGSGINVFDEAVADDVIDVHDSGNKYKDYVALDTIGVVAEFMFTCVCNIFKTL